MPAYVMAIFFYLAVTAAAQAQAVRVEGAKVLLTVPIEEGIDLEATFDFAKSPKAAFLSSSTNRTQGSVLFVNADGTIIAVSHIPVTKSSYVHLWLRLSDGDLLFLNNVNERVARLLRGRFAESAKGFLRVEAIDGRKIFLQTIDYRNFKGGKFDDYKFAITVKGKGQLSLAK